MVANGQVAVIRVKEVDPIIPPVAQRNGMGTDFARDLHAIAPVGLGHDGVDEGTREHRLPLRSQAVGEPHLER